ncbi:MAG: thiolase family protein [Dehalococcoidia bacterium]|nr:MAG: thiolase family protein [Dehalococcoidia bacterium]
MRNVAVVGAGMTRFGKYIDRGLKNLSREAVDAALQRAGMDKSAIEAAIVGNAVAGLMFGQECIRGQVVLRDMGIGGIPIINTENACASSSTAFHLAWLYVASGMYDVALALGVEKLYHEDKRRSFQAIGAAVDVEIMQRIMAQMAATSKKEGEEGGAGESRSMFMDLYAMAARDHMHRYGTTKEQFGRVAVKNHYHGSLNPHAQYRERYTLEEILASPLVAEPLTRLMCSPIGDGAAAAILCSEEKARQFTSKPIFVRASFVDSGKDHRPDEPGATERIAAKAYEMAGVTPEDLDLVELHDASAPAEIILYEELGLCAKGEGGPLIDSGYTELTGKVPVNTSGGLLSKGHPIGATGVAQICELFDQLRGEAGDHQVQGAKVALAENGGGMLRAEVAAISLHILST